MPSEFNPFAILNVTGNSTDEEIKHSFRTLLKLNHPDINKDNANAQEMTHLITKAYKVLINMQPADRMYMFRQHTASTAMRRKNKITTEQTTEQTEEIFDNSQKRTLLRRQWVETRLKQKRKLVVDDEQADILHAQGTVEKTKKTTSSKSSKTTTATTHTTSKQESKTTTTIHATNKQETKVTTTTGNEQPKQFDLADFTHKQTQSSIFQDTFEQPEQVQHINDKQAHTTPVNVDTTKQQVSTNADTTNAKQVASTIAQHPKPSTLNMRKFYLQNGIKATEQETLTKTKDATKIEQPFTATIPQLIELIHSTKLTPPLNKSKITHIGYSNKHFVLFLTFARKTIVHLDIPPKHYESIKTDINAVKYWRTNIKGKYKLIKLNNKDLLND